MTRRRRGASGIVVIYWRDIPAQVIAGGGTQKILLHNRFQVAIDRAATVAGLTDTDDYVEQWRRESTPGHGEDPSQAQAQARAQTLEDEFPRARLEALVANGGLDPDLPKSVESNVETEVETQ